MAAGDAEKRPPQRGLAIAESLLMKQRPFIAFCFLSILALAQGSKADDFSALTPALPTPMTSFSDALGQRKNIGDFKGQPMVLNFWATWCGPCVREMPALDRLAKDFASHGIAVAAISVDREGIKKVAPFFRSRGLDQLTIYMDESNKLANEMALRSLPSTFLINRDGLIIAKLEQPVDWDSEEIRQNILSLLNGTSQGAL